MSTDRNAPAPPPAPVQLRIEPGGWQLPVARGQTLLQAAQAAGVWLPRSCRNGSCRACLARLREGQVAWTIDWPGLLADEKAAGWILPCVATAETDLCIESPGARGPERG